MVRPLRGLLTTGLALALFAGHAAPVRAQDEAPAPPAPEDAVPAVEPAAPSAAPIAVLLLAAGGVESSVADALTELLIAAVAQRGGTGNIVGKEEFQSLLGQGDANTAACLESLTCLGRIGVALGVREVIAGTIGHRGGTWSFALNRIDLRTGATVGRVFREVEGDLADVVRTLPESVDDLYVATIEPGRLVVRASVEGAEVSLDGAVIGTVRSGEPVRRDLLPPGHHEVVVRAHGHTSYRRTIDIESGTTFAMEAELLALPHHGFEIPALTWVFGGVAFASIAAAIGLGVSSTASAPEDATQREVQAFYAARTNEAIAADICFAAAALAAAGAVIPLVLAAMEPARAPGEELALTLAPSAGGASLVLRGRFF